MRRAARWTTSFGASLRRATDRAGRPRHLVLVGLFGAALALVAMLDAEAAAPPTVQSVTATSYQSVNVTFNEGVFTTTTGGAGSGELTANDFTLTDTTCPGAVPNITGVTKVSQSSWTLTLNSAGCPHDTTVNLAAGAIYNATGDPIVATSFAIPQSTSDLTALLSGFRGIDVPVQSFDAPFISEWFEHEVADVATARDIADLIPGLGGVSVTSEAQVVSALEGLPGITDATFTASGLDLVFTGTDLGASPAFSQSGTVGVPGTDLEVTANIGAKLAFDGNVSLALESGTAKVLDPADSLKLKVNVTGTIPSVTGRLGFVDITSTNTALAVDGTLALDLDCPAAAASCAPSALVPTVTASGSASLSVPSVSIAHGSGSPLVIGDGTPNVVGVAWAALPDLSTPSVTSALDAYDLTNFSEASLSDVVSGIGFISGWLQELDTYAAMGTELPVLGGSLGQLTSASALLQAKLEGDGGLLPAVEALSEDLSAEDAVHLLCNVDLLPLTPSQCASALDPLTITTDAIEYEVSVDLPVTLFGDLGLLPAPNLQLDLGDDLEGLALSAQTGDWTGTSTIAVDFTLGLKIGSDADLAADLGFNTPGDLDEDGTGDATDADDDGDGVPESDTLATGDLCAGMAAAQHLSTEDLRHVNASGGVDATLSACDALVVTGGSVKTSPDETVTLDAEGVCLAMAQVHGIGVTSFIEMNGYVDTVVADVVTETAAEDCAAARSATGTYTYDTDVTPVQTANRIYVKVGTDPVLDASLDIDGTGIGMGVQLGFLDLGVSGSVSVDPGISLALVDPGDGAADDGTIDLAEFAEAADTDTLDDLLDLTVTGGIEAHFELSNNILPSFSPRLDVVGELSALGNGPDDIFAFVGEALDDPLDDDLVADRITVGNTLGELLDVSELSPTDVIRMIVDFSEQMATLADAEALSTEIPFVGMTAEDMLAFTRSLNDAAEAVLARDPETLGAFGVAVDEALHAAGMPGEITIGVTGEELTIGFDASRSVEASYPFNLDLGEYGVPIPLLQVDGGATLNASAGVTFEPELGILFDGTGITDRLFVRNVAPTFTASADATVNGAVSLGPLSTALNGDVSVAGTIAVGLNEDADVDTDGRFTIEELRDGFDSDDGLLDVEISGPFEAHLEIDTPEAFVDVVGDLTDPGATVITHNIDLSSIKLDLGTLVSGTTESAKFIGRLLQQSDALDTEIPLVGDALAGLVTVGEDLEGLADTVQTAWDDAAANSQAFLDGLDADLEGYLEPICPDDDCISIELTDPDGETTDDLNEASGILVGLHITQEETVSQTLSGGIDLAPVFQVDASVTPVVTYGYQLNLAFGLSIQKGFYIPEGDLLSLYAKLDTGDTIDVPVSIGGMSVAEIADGSAVIGGSVGPDDDAAGFEVTLPHDLSFKDIANRRKAPDSLIDARLSIDADLDLPIDTTFDNAPNLHVPVKFHWGAEASLTDGVDIGSPELTLGTEDEPIQLDASSFVSNVVAPLLAQANEYNPLSQVPQIKDTLDSNIPVLEATVRQLVKQAVGNQPAWKVFEFLVDLDDIVDTLQNDPNAGLIDIGWVEVLPTFEKHFAALDWFEQPSGASLGTILDSLNSTAGGSGTVKAKPPATPVPPTATSPGKMFTFPILDSPMTAVGMILGGDFSETVSFIEFRAPPLNIGPQIHWSQTLFDINTGFIDGSLSVKVDGFFGLEVRLGFGYDSTGLQPGRSPIDGIYLVDFKDENSDLQEIAVGGRITGTIDGRFSVLGGLANVRFRGSAGVNLTAGLDFNDESEAIPDNERGDGKFHLYEIANVATASIIPGQPKELAMVLCPFRPSVNFSAFLQLSGRASVLGITVFDDSYSEKWTILDWALQCQLETKIAKLVDGQLVLNAGPEHTVDRFDGEGDVAEGFALTVSGSNIHVAWTGAGSKPALDFPIADVNSIYGDLGVGADSVTIDDAITKPAQLIGGAGTDTLRGGGGVDEIQGNGDGDTLEGRSGPDVIEGADGNDSITGGAADDVLEGGNGDDTYAFAAGWGNDGIEDPVGNDTVTFAGVAPALTGSSSFGEATITDGTNVLTYAADQIDHLVGGSGGDTFGLSPDMPDGLTLDTAGGDDTVNAPMSGQTRTVTVTDSGSGANDVLNVLGTPGKDTFLSRATTSDLTTLPTTGFVAKLAPGDLVDRVNYDHSFDQLVVDTGAGRDKVAMDDVATPTTIRGADGEDLFQVGQVFEHTRDTAHGITAADVFATGDSTRGRLSKGISYATRIEGGDDNDLFNVYSNKATLDLFGGDGDDTFVLRAFIEAGSLVMKGEAGTDQFQVEDFDYLENDNVNIDGGAGNDTVVLVGTELDDGFLVSSAGLKICKIGSVTKLPDPTDCAITASYVNIESVLGQGLEGDDVFQVLSTAPTVATALFGSENSDTFVVGDAGNVTGVQGPLRINGEADPGFDASIAEPVVLPGEDATGSHPPAVTSGTNVGDTLRVDASANASGNTGDLTSTDVTGLGIGTGATINGVPHPGGVQYEALEFVHVQLDGEADTFGVASTHEVNDDAATVRTTVAGGAGADSINVRTVDDTTRVLGEGGDDTIRVGTLAPVGGSTAHGIGARLDVVGGGDTDRIYVDDTADGTDNTLRSVQGRLTGLGLSSEGITYDTTNEFLDVSFGDGADVANVRGTSIPTVLHGNTGDERFYVSDEANITTSGSTDHLVGTLDDVDESLTLDAGAGRHTLMVSDESATEGDGTISARTSVTESAFTGFSTGAITYQATGTYAGGITLWTSQGADAIALDGARRDAGVRTVTTLNTNQGADDVSAALDTGGDGFAVTNLEEGDDTFGAGSHTLPLVVFGGLGADSIATGTGDDIVFGDIGRVTYEDTPGHEVTVLGGGGPGDKTDGVDRPPAVISSVGVQGAADSLDTGSGADIVFGGTAADVITSGSGDDVVLGGHGRRTAAENDTRVRTRTLSSTDAGADTGDTLTAGPGADWVMGQQGSDTVDAGTGDDTVIGGHNDAAGLDAGDTINGGDGLDTILGDNGRAAPGQITHLFDVATTVPANGVVAGAYGDDVIAGDGDDDTLFGQTGDDRVFGGDAHDSIEGNHGADCLMGGDGQDNIVGGGSAASGVITSSHLGDKLLDGIDTISGDGVQPASGCAADPAAAGHADVIAGDNARIQYVLASGNRVTNTFDTAFVRSVVLFDVEKPATPANGDLHGPDVLQGGVGDDWVFGQGDNDTVTGDGADDYLEGGPAADTIGGGGGQDDIVGGSSSGDGAFRGSSAPAGLSDGIDTVHGDDSADVVLGDNGTITRPLTAGLWQTLGSKFQNNNAEHQGNIVRSTTINQAAEVSGAFAGDNLFGDAGGDEIIGQQGADTIQGGDGADAVVGDLGRITTTLESGANGSTPKTNGPFMSTPVRQATTLYREVQLYAFLDNGAVGDDVLLGGAGPDAIHGGPGVDLVNGNAGDDAVFGGNGGDALWGGPGNDEVFGGYGNDYLDVFPRLADPQSWKTIATVDHMQGFDLLYGGFDSDGLQADFQQNGPGIADRVVDWSGTYNAYFICNGGGAGTVIRSPDPSTIAYLQDVAQGRGAYQVKTPTSSSGFNEAAIVFTGDVKDNTKPAHADGRGMGVCPPP